MTTATLTTTPLHASTAVGHHRVTTPKFASLAVITFVLAAAFLAIEGLIAGEPVLYALAGLVALAALVQGVREATSSTSRR